jgi:hypothetical protein
VCRWEILKGRDILGNMAILLRCGRLHEGKFAGQICTVCDHEISEDELISIDLVLKHTSKFS